MGSEKATSFNAFLTRRGSCVFFPDGWDTLSFRTAGLRFLSGRQGHAFFPDGRATGLSVNTDF